MGGWMNRSAFVCYGQIDFMMINALPDVVLDLRKIY